MASTSASARLAGWWRVVLLLLPWSLIPLASVAQAPPTPEEIGERQRDALIETLSGAVGAPSRVELPGLLSFRLNDTHRFVGREIAERFLIAFGQEVPPGLVGLVLRGGEENWFATLRYVQQGHVPEKDIRAWDADDVLVTLRDDVRRRNKEDRPARPIPGVTGWLIPLTYQPERHLLSWSVLMPPKGSERDRDSDAVHDIVVFGRDGYLQLEAFASAGFLRERLYATTLLMEGVTFVDGKRYTDFVPGSDKVMTNPMETVYEVRSMHRATFLDWGWDTETLVAVGLGVVLVLGAGLLAIARLIVVRQRMLRQ